MLALFAALNSDDQETCKPYSSADSSLAYHYRQNGTVPFQTLPHGCRRFWTHLSYMLYRAYVEVSGESSFAHGWNRHWPTLHRASSIDRIRLPF